MPINPTLTNAVQSQTPISPSAGAAVVFGTVEGMLDNGECRVKTSAGPVDLTLPNGATLTAGQKVSLSLSADGIIVQPIANNILSGKLPADTVSLLQDLSGESLPNLLKALHVVADMIEENSILPSVLLSQIDKIGKSVDDVESLSASLRRDIANLCTDIAGKNLPQDLADKLEQIGAKVSAIEPTVSSSPDTMSKAVFKIVDDNPTEPTASPNTNILPVKSDPRMIIPTVDEELPILTRNVSVPLSKAEPEIATFLRNMSSSQLKNIPPQIFIDAVKQSPNGISFDDVKSLDAALVKLNLSSQNQSPITNPAILVKAFQSAGESQISATVAAKILAGSNGAADNAEKLFSLVNSLKLESPQLEQVLSGFSELSVRLSSQNKPSSDLIDALVRLAGFSFENDLAAGREKEASLKLALLVELGKIERDSTLKHTPATTGDIVASAGKQEKMVDVSQLKIHIEALINRLEAAQLSARPEQSNDGGTVQQTIAIPVHIGGEWSDLKMTFRREGKSGLKGKKPSRVFVNIETTLSGTGTVSADLDYHPGSLIDVALCAATERTRQWFADNSDAISQAISKLIGIPATVRIESPESKKVALVKDAAPTNTGFDAHA